jgi:spore coat polysaccharide biosynthesis protein SpsF
MKIVIVVQARLSSSRLPGKVLKPILGESLLYRQVERLRQVQNEVQVLVATSTEPSDDALVSHCHDKNMPVFRGNLHDCLDRHYQAGRSMGADVVIKIPSDCPLIDPRIVDRVIDFYKAHADKYDFVSNLHPATYPDGNDVEIMPMWALAQAQREAQRALEREHTTPYFWENPAQFRLGNITWESGLDYSMSHRFTIDYAPDYDFILAVYEALYPQNPAFGLTDILQLLEKNPAIYLLNADLAGVNWYRNHLDELKTIESSMTKKVQQNQV